jgi:hypothetical protein
MPPLDERLGSPARLGTWASARAQYRHLELGAKIAIHHRSGIN